MADLGSIEPSGMMRVFAAQMAQMYVAFRSNGFSEEQTMEMLGVAVQTIISEGLNQEDEE